MEVLLSFVRLTCVSLGNGRRALNEGVCVCWEVGKWEEKRWFGKRGRICEEKKERGKRGLILEKLED